MITLFVENIGGSNEAKRMNNIIDPLGGIVEVFGGLFSRGIGTDIWKYEFSSLAMASLP